MADQKAYQDWRTRTLKAQQIIADKSLAIWEKAHMAGGAYAGLDLSGLKSKHRHQILNRLTNLNAILSDYQLDTFDDYQNIEKADLQAMISIIKTLACPS